MISYTEQASDDDEDEDEEEEESDEDGGSDPEDGSYGGGGRRSGKRERRDTNGNGYDNAKQGRLKKKRDEMDRGWTWLGDRCPGERVRSHRAAVTKHQYL
jgi:chromatin structure-remodeling complex subunit SFH1